MTSVADPDPPDPPDPYNFPGSGSGPVSKVGLYPTKAIENRKLVPSKKRYFIFWNLIKRLFLEK